MDLLKGIKVLVAVASKHGSTLEIAEVIAEELRTANFEVTLQELQDKNKVSEISEYSAVILGSAIYAGNWLPQAKDFAEQHQLVLSKLPIWVFSSGPLDSDDSKPHDDPAKLAKSLGEVKIQEHHIFVGKLDLADLKFGERLITRLVKSPTGDFRNWVEIREWAQEIAKELRLGSIVVNSVTQT